MQKLSFLTVSINLQSFALFVRKMITKMIKLYAKIVIIKLHIITALDSNVSRRNNGSVQNVRMRCEKDKKIKILKDRSTKIFQLNRMKPMVVNKLNYKNQKFQNKNLQTPINQISSSRNNHIIMNKILIQFQTIY